MSYENPPGDGGRGPRLAVAEPAGRRSRTLITTLVILGVLLLAFVIVTGFWTDLLWYESVDAQSVFSTTLMTRVGLLIVFGMLMAGIVGLNMWLAYRFRPIFPTMSPEQASLERYRQALAPVRRFLFITVPAFLGLLAGVSASAEWQTWLEWRNSTEFGVTDPQFGMDVSFYVFTLPFLRFVLGFLTAAVVLAFIASVVVHYLYSGIRMQPADDRFSRAAQVHLGILAGVFVLLRGVGYWLDRFELSLSTDDFVPGVTYKDVNALIPGLTILAIISVVCALLFFVSAFRDGFTLAITGFVLLLGSAIIVGSIYPMFVQNFQVKPTELDRERPYIQRNIDATRASFGLDSVVVTPYEATDSPTDAAIAASKGTIENIRLLDPAVVSPTFNKLQGIRSNYRFPDSLDVDRYDINDRRRGTIIAARELYLAGLPDSQRNWANNHAYYTHGFGVVAAYDNTVSAGGQPAFFESDLPPVGSLDIQQPRIYYGEYSPDYSIVGAPDGAQPVELDYPDDNAPDGQAVYTYTGKGGVPIGNPINKLLFAAKYQDTNILLSDLVNEESKILEVRDPRDRVEKVAPWLTVDGDPYPVVADGRVVWMVDAYTTTDRYPNATSTSLADATTDALSQRASNLTTQPRTQINYIRNAVKATVDAYDGTVTLYEWDQQDPLLQTWMKIFPNIVQPRESIPQAILDHVRYPEDIFKVQRAIFAKYHVTSPDVFFSGQDFWNVPNDPTRTTTTASQPPYYLQVQLPGNPEPVFSLTTTYAPQRRDTLAAFMGVNSEPGPNYGQMRVLQLPSQTTIPGPKQVQNNFESDPTVASQLSLLRRGGSDVELGNLLSLPVAGGVLYVEPVYVRATSGEGFPLLQKVLVGYGSKVAMRDTLAQALTDVFEGAPVTPPDNGNGNGNGNGGEPTPTPSPGGSAEQRLAQAISDAQKAYLAGQEALKVQDWVAYGEAQKALNDALDAAAAASVELGIATPVAPSPSATPSASPSPGSSA
ncbi:MAG: UPF0182 family protein [Candidatus Nanopelagicales bacterium]